MIIKKHKKRIGLERGKLATMYGLYSLWTYYRIGMKSTSIDSIINSTYFIIRFGKDEENEIIFAFENIFQAIEACLKLSILDIRLNREEALNFMEPFEKEIAEKLKKMRKESDEEMRKLNKKG